MNEFYNLGEIFDAMFEDWEKFCSGPLTNSGDDIYHAANFPPVNIFMDEKTKDLRFEFALAGYAKSDVSITFEGDKMKLKVGAKEDEHFLKVLKKGFKTCAIDADYTVPAGKYNTESTIATMLNGVLIVHILALVKPKPRKVNIN